MTRLTLSEIWIYPIKSLGGINLEKATVRKKGLQFDRRWMLVDSQGNAMTQRVFPEMALFKLAMEGDRIKITYRKSDHTFLNVSARPSGISLTARVWDDMVDVLEVDPGASQWFSGHLGVRCRLVAFPEKNPRPVNPRYRIGNDHVSLADAYPFLIIGQRSLDDLNQRLADPVPMNRFRPNFVFTGGTPFMEDAWRDVSVGTIRFVAVKKSDRCVLTTVNQETAEKGAEPLRTLSTYRKIDNKVYFGQNMIVLDEGTVSAGDPVIPG